ncbi:MAG: hypothetical protein EPO51_04745 [Phenylobacterium sp.]|uniref:hypothetical protein n=1 Tax=Phenylobacterium sp. TaxID=1871053 RepID=UPI001220AB4C|nr:hypothetical protein [Phenylobacterium sp.]TAJ73603.1 MAG: hypothetical protein EPO51_04745 [Phenylobacterium sp.]
MLPLSIPALLRALLIWLMIIAVESAQGAMRHLLVSPEADFMVRQASVFIGALVIFAITWVCLRWMRLRTAGEALGVGGLWVALTLLFEIGVGRLLGLGWDRILADYDLLHGGLMPLGLLAMALTPWAARSLQARRSRHPD